MLLWCVLGFIALDLLIVGAFFIPAVQNFAVDTVTRKVSETWGCELSIGEMYLTPTLHVHFHNSVLRDHHDNDMIRIGYVSTDLKRLKVSPVQLYFPYFEVDDAEVVLRLYRGDPDINIGIWAKKLSSNDNDTTPSAGPFLMHIDRLRMTNSEFRYVDDEVRQSQHPTEMDYGYFVLSNLDFDCLDFQVRGGDAADISAKIDRLAFDQYTGFRALNLSGDFRINDKNLIFNDCVLVTPQSRLFFDLAFHYHDWSYKNFVDSVRITANLRPSVLDLADIACFAPAIKGMDNLILLKGQVNGPVNSLNLKDFYLAYQHHTFIEGDFSAENLTDIQNVRLEADLKNSNVSFPELAQFKLPEGATLSFPSILQNAEQNRLTGYFSGTLDDFKTELELQSSLGTASLDLIVNEQQNQRLACKGNVLTKSLALGRILGISDILGNASLSLQVQGTLASPVDFKNLFATSDLNFTAHAHTLGVRQYPLQNITANGILKNKRCEGVVNVADPNFVFNTYAMADFSDELPVYKVDATIDTCFIAQMLNRQPVRDTANMKGIEKFVYFVQQHPAMNLTFNSLKANVIGDELDNLTGTVMLDSLLYVQDTNKELKINNLRLVSILNEDLHKYRLTSNILNLSVNTNYRLAALADTLTDLAYAYLSNVLPARAQKSLVKNSQSESETDDTERFLTLNLETFQINRCLSFFVPDLRIAPRTELYLHINSDNQKDSLYLSCGFFNWKKKLRVDNLLIQAKELQRQHLLFDVAADSISILGTENNTVFKQVDVQLSLTENALAYAMNWYNPEFISTEPSQLNGDIYALSSTNLIGHFRNSTLYLKNYGWTVNEDNAVYWKDGDWQFDNFVLTADESSLRVDGKLSSNEGDKLSAEVRNIDLNVLNSFLGSEEVSFAGDISGNFNLSNKDAKKVLDGKCMISDFVFNDTPFGNVVAFAIMPPEGGLGFVGGIFNRESNLNSAMIADYDIQDLKAENTKAILHGGYDLEKEQLTIKADIDTLDLNFLTPFLASFSQHVAGEASGEISFIMKKDTFYFDGLAKLRKGELGIAYLNTIYNLDGQEILFNKKGFEFKQVKAKDKFGKFAIIDGYCYHNNFNDFTMRFDIAAKDFLALNTTKSQDMAFYGDGIVSGDIRIIGDGDKMRFTSDNLVTRKGTVFTLPLGSAETATNSDVIIFKSSDNQSMELPTPTSEIDVDLNFTVTQDALVRLELDPSIGGTLQAKVAGPFRLILNDADGLQLNGELAIQSGSFHLTLKDVIDKILTLQPNGTISFMGPVENATVNASAVYKTNASLNEILPSDVLGTTLKRMPVNAFLNLTGPLLNPNIDFSFQLPNSTKDVSTMFFSALDTTNAQKRTQQFFSLLVLGKFQSDNELTTNMVTSAVEYTGVELLTNTVSNLISQNLKYVDIGLNYRNADETHGAEYSVSAATSLYNDRIVIEGSFGYSENKDNVANDNNFIGDYSIEYALNEEKNWRVKVFNVTNQYSFLTQSSPYAQGVALIYKQEFNDAKDLRDSWKRNKKRKDESSKKSKRKNRKNKERETIEGVENKENK